MTTKQNKINDAMYEQDTLKLKLEDKYKRYHFVWSWCVSVCVCMYVVALHLSIPQWSLFLSGCSTSSNVCIFTHQEHSYGGAGVLPSPHRQTKGPDCVHWRQPRQKPSRHCVSVSFWIKSNISFCAKIDPKSKLAEDKLKIYSNGGTETHTKH